MRVLLVFFSCFLLFAWYLKREKRAEDTKQVIETSKPTEPAARPAITPPVEADRPRPATPAGMLMSSRSVNILELVDHYHLRANRDSANQEYRGQRLVFSNQVKYVALDVKGVSTVTLYDNVCCYFSKGNITDIANLRPEMSALISGKCMGKELENVYFDDCRMLLSAKEGDELTEMIPHIKDYSFPKADSKPQTKDK